MKKLKLLFVLLLVTSFNVYSNTADDVVPKEEITGIEKAVVSKIITLAGDLQSNVDEMLPLAKEAGNNISDATNTFVDSSGEFLSDAYDTIAPSIVNAVNTIIEEGSTLIIQYIIFTSLTKLLPILCGIFVLVYCTKKIRQFLVLTEEEAAKVEEQYKEDNEELKKSALGKYVDTDDLKETTKVFGYTFFDTSNALIYISGRVLILVVGWSLILGNLLSFIKVTFLPKLYLFEIAMDYLMK